MIPLKPLGKESQEREVESQESEVLIESQETRDFELNTETQFGSNLIRHQKYSLLSFLPAVLFQQFKFFLNLYFLLVALSQLIKPLQIGWIFTYFGPLIFVLMVNICKEAFDDFKRFKRDSHENSKLYTRLTPKGWSNVASSHILVGDYIQIHKNEKVPADCILLYTSESSGSCFVRTDQLDGETDWKLRTAVPITQKMDPLQFPLLEGYVSVQKPTKDIHSFLGKMAVTVNAEYVAAPLNIENTLWMNSVVASGSALGLVIYTGSDTRSMMNTNESTTKIGKVDHEINNLSKALASITLLMSLIMVAFDGFTKLWYIYTLRFLILFSSIIPISLRVNLDMGKALYSYFISTDEKIKSTVVRTSSIPEELGRIDFLFTDKTGTLTKNGIVSFT
jgi:phospholipid-translocating ATPase